MSFRVSSCASVHAETLDPTVAETMAGYHSRVEAPGAVDIQRPPARGAASQPHAKVPAREIRKAGKDKQQRRIDGLLQQVESLNSQLASANTMLSLSVQREAALQVASNAPLASSLRQGLATTVATRLSSDMVAALRHLAPACAYSLVFVPAASVPSTGVVEADDESSTSVSANGDDLIGGTTQHFDIFEAPDRLWISAADGADAAAGLEATTGQQPKEECRHLELPKHTVELQTPRVGESNMPPAGTVEHTSPQLDSSGDAATAAGGGTESQPDKVCDHESLVSFGYTQISRTQSGLLLNNIGDESHGTILPTQCGPLPCWLQTSPVTQYGLLPRDLDQLSPTSRTQFGHVHNYGDESHESFMPTQCEPLPSLLSASSVTQYGPLPQDSSCGADVSSEVFQTLRTQSGHLHNYGDESHESILPTQCGPLLSLSPTSPGTQYGSLPWDLDQLSQTSRTQFRHVHISGDDKSHESFLPAQCGPLPSSSLTSPVTQYGPLPQDSSCGADESSKGSQTSRTQFGHVHTHGDESHGSILLTQCGPLPALSPTSPVTQYGPLPQDSEQHSQTLRTQFEHLPQPASKKLVRFSAQCGDFQETLDTILDVYVTRHKPSRDTVRATARAIVRCATKDSVNLHDFSGLIKDKSFTLWCAVSELWRKHASIT